MCAQASVHIHFVLKKPRCDPENSELTTSHIVDIDGRAVAYSAVKTPSRPCPNRAVWELCQDDPYEVSPMVLARSLHSLETGAQVDVWTFEA